MPIGVDYVEMQPSAAELVAGLSRYAGSLRSLKQPLEQSVDRVIRPGIEERFAMEGPGWEPLSPETIATRRREGFSDGPILTKTGNLRTVATQKNIWDIQGQQGTAFVTDLPGAEYGWVHEFGGGRVPQRSFLEIGPEEMDQIEGIFQEFLAERAAAFVGSGVAVSSVLGRG